MSLESAVLGAICGALGAGISYFFIKDKKVRQITTVLIGVGLFFTVKVILQPYYVAARFDSYLRSEYHIFEIIATYYPNEYKQYINNEKSNILNNGGENNDIINARKLINDVTQKSIPYASTKSIYTFLIETANIDKKLYAINPTFVLALEYPQRYPSQNAQYFVNNISTSDLNRKMLAEEGLIESSFKDRDSSKVSNEDVKSVMQLLQNEIQSLNERYGKDLVDDTFTNSITPFKDPNKSAEITIAFYDDIIKTGSDIGGLLFKVLFILGQNTNNNAQR